MKTVYKTGDRVTFVSKFGDKIVGAFQTLDRDGFAVVRADEAMGIAGLICLVPVKALERELN